MFKYLSVITSFLIGLQGMEFDSKGQLRLGYQYHDDTLQSSQEVAIGGSVGLEFLELDNYAIGATLFGTKALDEGYGVGTPFFGSKQQSYMLLGEAYLSTQISKTKLTGGRQEFDSPYVNSDDIGMIPNRFEGITINSQEFKNIELTAAYLTKWSGVGSPEPEHFQALGESNYVAVLGITYNQEDMVLQAWHYDVESMASLWYCEIEHLVKSDNFNLTTKAQYTLQDYTQWSNAIVYGAALDMLYKDWGVTLSVAYNKAYGNIIDNFFGGGPFYTNSEYYTIADLNANPVQKTPLNYALLIGACIDGATLGISNLTISANHIHINRDAYDAIRELDMVIEYQASSALSLKIIYANLFDNQNEVDSFKNLRFFVNIDF